MKNIKIPKILTNFYVISTAFFLLWMFVFDTNDWISQYNRKKRLEKMIEEKAFYEKKTKEIQADYRDLKSNSEVLEKFAREKYYLKKDKEDVFILVEDEENEKK
jgi:cell division protein DivIC